jgi:hypothetical protein
MLEIASTDDLEKLRALRSRPCGQDEYLAAEFNESVRNRKSGDSEAEYGDAKTGPL